MSEIKDFKCKTCGGHVSFSIQHQKLKCGFCGKLYEVEEYYDLTNENSFKQLTAEIENQSVEIFEEQLQEEVELQEQSQLKEQFVKNQDGEFEAEIQPDSSLVSYVCKSCGGEIIVDNTIGATKCPFCDSNVVINEAFDHIFKPDLVLPFKITKEEAVEIYKNHFSNKLLLPTLFKTMNYIEEIKGVYVPFWIFDAGVTTDMNAQGVKIKHYNTLSYEVTERYHYDVYRKVAFQFYGVPVDGSKTIENKIMESLEPFDSTKAVPYTPEYLAGFYAHKYDVSKEECREIANSRMRKTAKITTKERAREYNYLTNPRFDIKFDYEDVNHALYPVYMISVRFEDKPYLFSVNGQTGKIVGDLPIDKNRCRLLTIGTFLASAALSLMILAMV